MLKEILEVLTIGFPFCVFKIVAGLFLGHIWLVILGAIDVLINLTNLFSVIIFKRRLLDPCFFGVLVHLLKRPKEERIKKWMDLGNSLDVVVSFSLVALMIAGGSLRELPAEHLHWWNLSVILNVFGAGSSRLGSSIKSLKEV
jgi:hypothetical protein